MPYNIQPFIDAIDSILATHSLGQPGAYRRWNWSNGASPRDLGLNPYGCADAANLRYTIGRFPAEPAERAAWVQVLQGLQDPASGLFHEGTHHDIHCTAHCTAALELFEARPAHPLAALAPLREPAAMQAMLASLAWAKDPWNASHRGAGLYAALVLAGEVDLAWEDAYFAWLAAEIDLVTGLWRRGCVDFITLNLPGKAGQGSRPQNSLFPHLAGSFHYLFNHQYARRPIPHPEALVDICLEISGADPFPLGQTVGFAEIDWVYCLGRGVRQSGHRCKEAQATLADFAAQYIPYLLGLDPTRDEGLNDLHALFGAACCLAELQAALPGQLRSARPLRLVLDRRPFI
jgi:hypothetical protein